MACRIKLWFLLTLALFSHKLEKFVDAANLIQEVPCYFVFGDSLADNGNNNNLNTQAKVNYLPYGIDFCDGPTGRFTNGRNYADFIGELLGVGDKIPSFAASDGKIITNGVNYASGGCGILPETGRNLGEVISFDQQLINHNAIISRLNSELGDSKKAAALLNQCMYTVGFGSNDYINNYLMPNFFPTSKLYTPDQYAQNLITTYSKQLTTLYNYGARKIAVYGLGPIGCIPHETLTKKRSLSGCIDSTNDDVQLFNGKIQPLVDDLNNKLANAHFIYINVSNFSPFIGVFSPCCKISETVGAGQCLPNEKPCNLRSFKPFFDGFHPTETGHLLLAGRSYIAISPLNAYPYDIRHLAHLDQIN